MWGSTGRELSLEWGETGYIEDTRQTILTVNPLDFRESVVEN